MIEIPVEGRSRETKIRRDARGRWYDDDVPITHEALCRAFDGWIERADDGRYCLKNEINWAYVTIEGPPVLARALVVLDLDAPSVRLVLSGDREESLDLATLREGPDGDLYCDVRGGTLPCRLTAPAMMALSEHLHDDGSGTVLWLGATRVRPPRVSDPLVPFRAAVVERAPA
ncbi:MAG: hypothetical protein K1X94_06310 [Sandaracinaceae bacterium]|nr:hypothetical protein [Sandaracinaceae bacterium]